MSASSPYPGLRPFRRDETDIFFGREQHTDQLLQKLGRNRFLAVVGASGCGKSSLARAGMISSLEGGFVLSAGPNWRIAEMRPGSHPMQRLAVSVLDALSPGKRDDPHAAAFIHSTLRRGPLGLLEVLQDVPLPPQANLLILVDQFEEIFRYHREGGVDESEAFIALLLESALQPRFPVYVAITMRSDYIGDCAVFAGLPETINESQYLTPRLTREQRASAIVGPARVFGGDVHPTLVNSLLNDMGSDPNQLPLMQHVLMRMWAQTSVKGSEERSRAAQEGNPAAAWPVLTLDDYTIAGGLKQALSMHANEAYADLKSEKKQYVAQVLFRALCERGTDKRDERRPVEIETVCKVAGVSHDEVAEVVEVFREPGRSFITPGVAERLYPTTRLDISHECLIKRWDRLNEWADHESQSAETFCFMAKSAREWKKKKAALWRTPNLEVGIDWRMREHPNPTWAQRYEKCAGDYDLAMQFLDASIEQRRLEEAEAVAEQQRQLLRARRTSRALAVALVILGAVLYWYYSAYVREDVHYFANFARQKGLPTGVGEELSYEQVRHRAVSIALVRKGSRGPVKTMVAVNSDGRPTPYHNIGTHLAENLPRNPFKECRYEYYVGADRQVVYERAYDRDSNLVWGLVYSPRRTNDSVVRAYYVGSDGLILSRDSSAAELIEIHYSPKGFEERIRYLDRNGNPQRGLDNAYGRQQKFDDQGLLSKVVSLGRDGRSPMVDDAGNAILECKYDPSGNLVESTAFDAAGNPTLFKDGYHKVVQSYDEMGNETERAYFDKEGMRVLNREWIHRAVFGYDQNGKCNRLTFLDTDRKPALCSDGYASVTYAYDARGNAIEAAYLDVDGLPCLCKEAYASTKLEYDSAGNVVRQSYFGVDGIATNHGDGYASYTAKFDKKGHRIEFSYRSISGKLFKPTSEEAAGWKSEYDGRGREIRRMFLRVGNETSQESDSYAGWTRSFDQRGYQTEMMYLDNNGKPFKHGTHGYASWRRQFDADGNRIVESFYDRSDRPCKGEHGYAVLRAVYDKDGNQIEEAYFDPHGARTKCDEGHAGWERIDTASGRMVRIRYLDSNGRYFTNSLGYAGKDSVFDDNHNLIRTTYLDTDGNSVVSKYGYASVVWDYDKRGNVSRTAYFDSKNRRVMCANGYAGWRHEYDDRRNRIRTTYLDIHDNPVVTNYGYAIVEREYNTRGDNTRVAFLDSRGNPVVTDNGYAGWQSEYDQRGMETLQRYVGIKGETVKPVDDYAQVRRKYDRLGKLIYVAYTGVNGKPVSSADGYAIYTATYDSRGNQIRESHFDKDSSLWLTKEGYAETSCEYDDRGNQISQSYYGAKRELIKIRQGYAIWRAEYDAQDNLTKLSYYGTNGKPVLGMDGYSELRMKYNDRGQVEEVSTYDTNGHLVVNRYQYAKAVRRHDTSGNLVEISWFGGDDKPCIASSGYAKLRRLYDEEGNLLEESYYGRDGRPMMLNGICARLTRKYDDRGNIVGEAYFGTDGKPVLCLVDGIVEAARWVARYDATGELTRKEYYDRRDQLLLRK